MGSSEYGTYHHGFQFQPPPSIIIHIPPSSRPHLNSQDTSFPILLVAIIGILTTAFVLVSYYVFVIKCCLNSQRINFLGPRRREEDRVIIYTSSATTTHENSGLDESVIRAIPIVRYKSVGEGRKERSFCECAVCLNEFQGEEKLRILPSCSHAFHIDCIDIWLQSHANCPLCRSSISITNIQFPSNNPSSFQDRDPFRNTVMGGDENFVIIEVRNGDDDQTDQVNQRRRLTPKTVDSLEVLEQRSFVHNKARKLHHVSSMGDECIDVRRKDDQFAVQPIRRSISMDSSADRKLYLSVQEILQQNKHFNEFSSKNEGCTSSSSSSTRIRSRSFFSFGSGRGSRNSVLSVELDPQN